MKRKSVVVLVVTAIMVNLLMTPASAETGSGSPALVKIGITENAYVQMSVHTQILYSDLRFGEAVTQIRYFRVIESNSAEAATYGLSQGPLTIEVTEEEFNAGTAARKSTTSSAYVNPDQSSNTWYKLLVQITKEIGSKQYAVSVFLNIYHQGFPGLKPRTFYIAGSVNSNMSPISGSESCYVIYKPNGEEHLTRAPHKWTGYGFDFLVDSATHYNYTAGMTFLAEPNISTLTLVDAYGYAGWLLG